MTPVTGLRRRLVLEPFQEGDQFIEPSALLVSYTDFRSIPGKIAMQPEMTENDEQRDVFDEVRSRGPRVKVGLDEWLSRLFRNSTNARGPILRDTSITQMQIAMTETPIAKLISHTLEARGQAVDQRVEARKQLRPGL